MTDAVERGVARVLVDVRLIGVPLDLYHRASQHHEELRREFALIAQSPRGVDDRSVPARLLALGDELTRRFASFTAGTSAELEAAIEAGQETIDALYRVPPEVGPAAAEFGDLLDEADEFCRAGEELLTLAAPPEVVALRRWVLGEFVRQAAGEPATPWSAARHDRAGS